MKYYLTCSTPEEPIVYLKIKAKTEQLAIQTAYKKYKRITSVNHISTTRPKTTYNSQLHSLQTYSLAGKPTSQLKYMR